MEFEDPFAISTKLIQDLLIFHIFDNGTDMFYSPELNKTIHNSSRTLSSRIRKQMENSEFNNQVKETTETGAISMEALLIMTLMMNIFSGNALVHFVMLIRSL